MKRTMLSRMMFVVLLLTSALSVQAQDVIDSTAIATEVAADTIAAVQVVGEVEPAPDWYVAPEIPEARRAPKRVKSAVFCPVDSVCTFDENGNPVSVSEYDYDNAGRVISVTTWTYTDGKRVGISKNEYGFDANDKQVMTATYEWVASISKWRGLDKTEYAYDSEDRIISNTEYAWVDDKWVPQTKLTYEYDSEGREKEFTTYTRDVNTNKLVFSKRRTQEWDAEGRQVLDVQYTAYDGTDWSAGTKKIWKFDANGNQTEYAYYSSIANHNWVGSSRELWTYDGTTKTKYEKFGWANGAWVGSSKEEWGYTAGQLTMNAKYTWSNGAWVGVSKEEWDYTAGQLTLNAKYTWSNGAWVGVSKEEWTYTSGKPTLHATYTWSNGAWVGVNKEEWVYVSGKDKQYKKSTWTNGAWMVVEQKDWTYTSNNLTLYEYKKLESGAWVLYEQEIYDYSGKNKTLEEKYKRQNGSMIGVNKEKWEYTSGKVTRHEQYIWADSDWTIVSQENSAYDASSNVTLVENYSIANGVWTGEKKEEYTYSAKKKTSTITYAWTGGVWVRTDKEVWGYTSGKVTLHELHVWEASDWTITLQEKSAFDAVGNQTLVEICKRVDGVWTGEIKEEYTFNAAKQKTVIIVSTWTGSEWVYSTKTEADYDGEKQILDAKYVWQNGAWVGDGARVETTYTDEKITLLLTFVWNTSTANWTSWARRELVYDNLDRLVGDTTRRLVDDKWEYYAIQTHGFDSKGHDTLAVTGIWNGSQWDTTYIHKETYLYTASGKPLFIETYEGQPGSITSGQKSEYTYDAADHQIKFMQYEWKNGTWTNKSRSEQTYDAAGNQTLSESYKWDKNSKKKYAWIGTNKYEYAYDYTYTPKGRQTMQARYTWDAKKDKWKGASRSDKEYDAAGNTTAAISYDWMSSGWVESTRESYVYDSKSRVVELVVGVWTGSSWGNNMREAYEYDNKGQTISTHKYWWRNGDWSLYYLDDKEYDTSDNKLRRSTFGSWTEGVLDTYTDDHYFYRCDTHFFTIRFTNDDGTVLQSENLEEGTMPVYTGATPTKAADDQYTYTFKGWDKTIVAAHGAATYTATYNKEVKKYLITFVNEDGQTVIEAKEWAYGATPVPPTAPTKPSTEEHTYTFAGWSPEVVAVTGATTYTATFTTGVVKYTITFKNGNDVLQTSQVEYGSTPKYDGATPTKQADAQYSYTFKGWDPAIAAVTGAATYNATFSSTVNKYTITFKNGETVLQSTEVEYGSTPAYTGTTPTQAATAQYTYAFNGWDKELAAVTEAATYNATFSSTVNTYTITFKNGDKVLQSTEVAYGTTPQYTGATPTQAATDQYSYTFKGWDKTIAPVTGAATYTAQFTATLNSYLITFKNYDGTVLDSHKWDYGCLPNLTDDPTRPADAQYTYTFAGWDKDVEMVTKDATYTAIYTTTLNKYTITWRNDDNTLIDQTTVEYGVVPTHADVTKAATAEWTYTFAGWSPEIKAVTGEATYTAIFNSTKNKYTITWLNDDNTQIDQTVVEYGVVPTHADAEKAATAQFTYTFAGWTPEVEAVTGEATYKATFTETVNKYTVTFFGEDGETVIEAKEWEYGQTPTCTEPTKDATAQFTYTFAGWTPEVEAVTGTAEYKATFTETVNKYTVTFFGEDGETVIEAKEWEYGQTPTCAEPTKEATAQFTYTFAGWTPEVEAVTGEATYKATFTETVNKYTVTFFGEDGETVIEAKEWEYGQTPTCEEPTKEATAQLTYTFAGWTPEVKAVTGTAEYKATFTETVNKYTVTFFGEDGETVIEVKEWEYGQTPTCDEPTKEATAQFTYTFAGWTPEVEAVTGEATYKATFTETVNKYTVTFFGEDGETVIEAKEWEYGQTPTCDEPTKEATAQFTYTFAGWTPEVKAVTGTAEYKATFTETVNKYTVTFFGEDGETVIEVKEWEYGATPTCTEPTKEATAQFTYTFAGWTPEVKAVTGTAEYKATFTETVNKYTVTFFGEDGETVIEAKEWEYGQTPTCEEPTKEATAQFTYTFAGWTPEVEAVTGEATYKATFTETVNKYTVTFFGEDGETVIEAKEWEYGQTPTCEEPTKEATAQFTYTFAGWTPEVVAVTGEASYTATFTATLNTYDITFEVKDDPEKSYTIPGVPYGTPLSVLVDQILAQLGGNTIEDDKYIYTFAGLEGVELTDIVTSDATYYVLYTVEEKPGTGVDNTRVEIPVQKIIRNDQVFIIREGKMYSIHGIEVR